ncbi:AfsR/SARP family transcriptional regulator [Streptosporangium sp. NPDC003464]
MVAHGVSDDRSLRFSILGPLEASRYQRILPVSARRPRVVLATMLLAANKVVSVQRLTRALWPGWPPDTARTQIHYCVSSLRKRLAPADVILSHPSGYALTIAEDQLDALAFHRLVSDAEAARENGDLDAAARLLRQGLSLWRGPALDGLDVPCLGAEAARLDELRLLAFEELVDVELRLGRAQEVIPGLREQVALFPLREHLAAQLMTALHRAGRRSEALAVFRGVRRRLRENEGLGPGPELRGVEQLILSADASPGRGA